MPVEMLYKVLCLVVFTSHHVLTDDVKHVIGGIFYEDEAENLTVALELGAEYYNFDTVIKTVQRGQILDISKTICELSQEAVIGVVDGLGGRATAQVQAISDMLELPHVIVQPNDLYAKNWSIVNMYPSADAYNKLLINLIIEKEWTNFTLLYVRGYSLRHMSSLMEMGNFTDPYYVSVRELSGDDYRDVLINAKEHGYYNFVVDCPSEKLEQFLRQAQQVGLMADEHSYIFLSPDLFTLDLSRYRYGGANITGFLLTNVGSQDLWTFTSAFNNKTDFNFDPENVKTKIILIHDAVKVFSEAVNKITRGRNVTDEQEEIFAAQPLSCQNSESWVHGSTLLNFMKTNKVQGLTGSLSFDGLGERDDIVLNLLEVTSSGNQTFGIWDNTRINFTREYLPLNEVPPDSIMKNKTFKVLIATTPPYAYVKESSDQLEKNDQYEGFAVDLIVELAKIIGFNYDFEVQNNYTIMTNDVQANRADFAICDFTMTTERQAKVDFSTPFMHLGIGILYKQPSKQPPAMFSFMAVFSVEVWLWMLFIQMCIGAIMIFVGRISQKEWQNPVPCVEQPEELSNQFSFANSVWLIIGSVMQQGSEIAPIALAPRMITSIWWFFTMVMVASYVGTLVAFLTVEKNVLPFNNVDELAEQKSISYGAKSGGSTETFFKTSKNKNYINMYKMMTHNEGWMPDSNDKGVEMKVSNTRCEEKQYAFFTESTSIEYYKNRHCDLLQVGDLLDAKSYGIGMPKQSPYKPFIDDALLKLKENGELQKLKDLWWTEKRGGGKCTVKKEEEAKQLSMKNMLGAFVVLGAGCIVGLFISILDMLWWLFKRSIKYNTTFKQELIQELKFFIKLTGDVKPVRRPKSTEGISNLGEKILEDDRAVDESKDELGSLRSMRTLRSGRSTSTRRSTHSHCSRHSPSELSIAFARRRRYD